MTPRSLFVPKGAGKATSRGINDVQIGMTCVGGTHFNEHSPGPGSG